MRKEAMAAQFTEVTLEDMTRFLNRGWRTLRPKQFTERGEVYFDLTLSQNVAIRVWTSIGSGRDSGASVGEDAIRVQFFSTKTRRPLMKGKAPIVKRTQGWRNNLQDRIEDLIETYEDREGYWETLAGGRPPQQEVQPEQHRPAPSPTPTPRDPEERDPEREEVLWERYRAIANRESQKPGESAADFFVRLCELAGWTSAEVTEGLDSPEGAAEVKRLERLIPAPTAPRRGEPLRATFTKLRDSSWGLRIQGVAQPGDRVVAVRQSGQRQTLTVGEIMWKGQDRDTGMTITVATIRSDRQASEVQAAEEEVDYEQV